MTDAFNRLFDKASQEIGREIPPKEGLWRLVPKTNRHHQAYRQLIINFDRKSEAISKSDFALCIYYIEERITDAIALALQNALKMLHETIIDTAGEICIVFYRFISTEQSMM